MLIYIYKFNDEKESNENMQRQFSWVRIYLNAASDVIEIFRWVCCYRKDPDCQ